MLSRETLLLLIFLLGKLLFVSGSECVEPGVTCSKNCSEVLLCVDVGGSMVTVVLETCGSGFLCDVDAETCVAESQSSCSTDKTCLKPGLTCSVDCSQVIFCNEVEGQLQEILVEQCENNLFCNADSGTCVPQENSSCQLSDFVFKCTSRRF